VEIVEREASHPTELKTELFNKENTSTQPSCLTIVVISILSKIKVKFKDFMMLFCYDKNINFIYYTFLTKFLSIDCLF